MKDFRGVELAIGDTVAWTVAHSQMHQGEIVGFTPKKAQVHSHDGYGKPQFNANGVPSIYLVDTLRIAKL